MSMAEPLQRVGTAGDRADGTATHRATLISTATPVVHRATRTRQAVTGTGS